MKVPQKWLNSDTGRMWMTALELRSYVYDEHTPFIPFFKYEIGDYKPDYILYFQSEPSRELYYGEAFSKMNEYIGYSLVDYIEFHYKYCEDKMGFVQFLRYTAGRSLQVHKRIRWIPSPWPSYRGWRDRMRTVLQWAEEEFQRLRELERCLLQQRQNELHPMLAAIQQEMIGKTESMLDLIAQEVGTVMRAHSGKIAVYNEHHLTRIIQLFILMQYVENPDGNGARLFKSFTDTDMVTILQQFEALGDKRPNTLQKKIAEVRQGLRLNDPVLMKLQKALDDFFFR